MLREYYVLRDYEHISLPHAFTVKINGEPHLLYQNVHGGPDGTLESPNWYGKTKTILRALKAAACEQGYGDKWIIHPCHPKEVIKANPEYKDHILGWWDGITRHYYIFGHIIALSIPMAFEMVREAGGIARYIAKVLPDNISSYEIEGWEAQRIQVGEIKMSEGNRLMQTGWKDIGKVKWQIDIPPFDPDVMPW